MRINKCVKCASYFNTQDGFIFNVCFDCETPKAFGFPALRETVSLRTMKNVSKTRLSEMDKRVMLPEAVKDKDYVVGTREREKILDHTVDLTP